MASYGINADKTVDKKREEIARLFKKGTQITTDEKSIRTIENTIYTNTYFG